MLPHEMEREERVWTQELLAATATWGCPWCRAEVIRTGGVVGTCPEYPQCSEGESVRGLL